MSLPGGIFRVRGNSAVAATGFAFLLVFPGAATGGPPGREAFAFTSLAGDARSVSLGSGARALLDGQGALYGNPAAGPIGAEYSVGLTHLSWTDGFFGETIEAMLPVGDEAVVGAGGFVFLHDPVPVTSEILPDGTGALARPIGVALSLLGAAYLSQSASFGMTARAVHEQIGDDMIEGLALDAGGTWFPDPSFGVGLAMRGFGGALKSRASRDPFPMSFDGTVRWEVGEPLPVPVRAYLGGSVPLWGPVSGGLGVEIGAWYGAFLRLMVEYVERGTLRWAVGLGGRRDQWNVDYTLAPAGDLGLCHRIGLTLKFTRRLRLD